MDKIETLNSLEVVDWSCTGEECEYVLAENTEANRVKLIDVGFTEEQIMEADFCEMKQIDLATLAFNYAGAKWFHSQVGFSVDPEFPKKRLPM